MKLYDVFARSGSYQRHDGTFGVEIETETKNDYNVPQFKLWEVHNDNSLRGFGREYVLRAPLSFGKDFDTALEEFQSKTEKIPFIKDSVTTSVHVHVNMLNENFTTLGNFVTAYTFVEPMLIRYSGPDRKSNLFCLPMVDAEDTVKNIRNMFSHFEKKNFRVIHNFTPDVCKYAALNLSSLGRLGSLEIRSFRGTPDVKEIRDWVGILNNMLTYSRQEKMTPHDIILDYKNRGVEVLTDIFGEYRPQLRWNDEGELLKKSLYFASSVAYSVKDWAKMDVEPKGTVTKKNIDLDKLAMTNFGRGFHDLDGAQQEAVIREAERLLQRPFVNEFGEEWADAELNQAPQPVAQPGWAPPPAPGAGLDFGQIERLVLRVDREGNEPRVERVIQEDEDQDDNF